MKISSLSCRDRKMWELIVFLSRLIVLALPLYLVIFFAFDLYPMQVMAASQSASIMSSLGWETVLDGVMVTANGFTFMVNQDCTAWKSMLFFFALVFAFPGVASRKRLLGLAAGIPLIWIGNLARIIGTVGIEGIYGEAMAMLVHDYLWRLGLVALVLGLWLAWIRICKPKSKGRKCNKKKD